jgi:hypothetical protein
MSEKVNAFPINYTINFHYFANDSYIGKVQQGD